MKELRIMVNRKLNGVIFSLTLAMRRAIKEAFPEARPAAKIFVGYDEKADFNFYHGSIERFIFPALVGIDPQQGLANIDDIVFVDPVANEVIFTMDKIEA